MIKPANRAVIFRFMVGKGKAVLVFIKGQHYGSFRIISSRHNANINNRGGSVWDAYKKYGIMTILKASRPWKM